MKVLLNSVAAEEIPNLSGKKCRFGVGVQLIRQIVGAPG